MEMDILNKAVEKLVRCIALGGGGIPTVYNFTVPNSESVYRLHGYAKYLVIHNAGSSDVVLSFPSSAGKYYTIPSGDSNANPLVIPDIAKGMVDKLILRSNGASTKVEVMALMWPEKMECD